VSWEQLAAFTEADVATVDSALTDFPGRIERDEWVSQAQAFVLNGHRPVERDRSDEYKAELAKRNARIKELEAQLAARPKAPAAPKTKAAKAGPVSSMTALRAGAWKKGTTKLGTPGAAFIANGHAPVAREPKPRPKPAWSKGTTKLGTPGAGHTDDLKVVNGIGPKMEGILKDYGITAWEQLAAFTKADVEKVTEAIDTFPGRIERDEWVAQAKDLVKRFPLKSPYDRPTRKTYLNEM